MSRERGVRAAAVALVTVALLLAGCGSDSDEPPSTTAWADGVCSSIDTWTSSIAESAASVVSDGPSKESLQSAADKVKAATETLQSDLSDLGQPETASGAEAQSTVDQLASQLSADTDAIRSTIDGVSGLADVVPAASAVSSTLAKMQDQVEAASTRLRQLDPGGELEAAFKNSSACQQLVSPTPTLSS